VSKEGDKVESIMTGPHFALGCNTAI
jgi:hypothetical protein